MITKLVVYGTDRMDAIGKMKAALSGADECRRPVACTYPSKTS